MKRDEGLTLVALAIMIGAILVLAGILIHFMIGENGILTEATKEEDFFDKEEIVEELNVKITEKYLDVYGKATKDGKNNIEEFYDGEKVILFLKGYTGGETGNDYSVQNPDKVIIEDLVGHAQTAEDSRYFIILSALNKKIEKYGKGNNEEEATDYFYIKVSNDSYTVHYINTEGEDEEIGELKIEQSLSS